MALLLTSVFGVTGCGSDENTQLETEITQLETEISQFEARVDALEEQAGSRVTNLTLDQTDDAVQFQSRSKNAAPGIDASGAPSKADCDGALDLRDLLDRHAVQEKRELPDESQLHYRPDDLDLLDRLYDYTGLLDRLYYDIGFDLDFDALHDDLQDILNNCFNEEMMGG